MKLTNFINVMNIINFLNVMKIKNCINILKTKNFIYCFLLIQKKNFHSYFMKSELIKPANLLLIIRDRQLTTNFELWVEIFCVPTCFHMRIPKPCLSVCPHPEKRNHHSFVNVSPTLVIDTSMERSSRVLQHGNPKMWKKIKKGSKLNFVLTPSFRTPRKEIALAPSMSVLH